MKIYYIYLYNLNAFKKIIVNNNFVGDKKASEILGVHQRMLYNWDEKGKLETIRTPSEKRLYNVEKILSKNKLAELKSNIISISKKIQRRYYWWEWRWFVYNLCKSIFTKSKKWFRKTNRSIEKKYPKYK